MTEIILTCPSCETRYKSDSASIGQGRTVRCAQCGETWFAQGVAPAVDPDALALAENEASETAIPSPATKSFGKAPPAPRRELKRDDVPETNSDPMPASEPQPGADAMMRDMADAQKLARRKRTIRLIWFVAFLLFVIASAIAWFNRQEIVNRYPQTAALYQALGAEIRQGGLELDPPLAKTVILEGETVLRVESRVRNLTRDPLPVPLIELTLHDAAGRDLAQWFVETQPRIIAPRGELPFTTDYADPPDGGTGVRYRLAYEAS